MARTRCAAPVAEGRYPDRSLRPLPALGEDSLPPVSATVAYSDEEAASSWEVLMTNDSTGVIEDYTAFVVCAS